MLKKFVAVLITMLLFISVLPATALANTEKYALNICPEGENTTSVTVTSDNMSDVLGDGTVAYTPATDTSPAVLTLTNAKLRYIQTTDNSPLNIVFNGENSFYVGQNQWNFCINIIGDLELFGSGTVTLKNDFYNPNDPYGNYGYPCIQTESDLTIKSVTITAESKAGTNAIYCIGDMVIAENASVTGNTDNYPSLWSAGTMTITDSKVQVTVPNGNGIWSDGAMEIGGKSEVEVTAGTNGVAFGSYAGIAIKDQAKITVLQSYNGLVNDGTGDINISGKPEVNINSSYGIWNINGNLNISGGTVNIYGSGYASVNKPDLTNYANAAVYAGESEQAATLVADPASTNYHGSKYVRITQAYAVTISTDGNGTANVNPASAVENTEVTLSAVPNTGYQFKEWQVISGGVTVVDNRFTMGTSDVEIKAIFEPSAVVPQTPAISAPIPYPEVLLPKEEQKVAVLAGNTATLSVLARYAGVYEWYIDRNDGKGFVRIPDADGAEYMTTAVTANNDGYRYICVVRNLYGAVESPMFTLEIVDIPEIPQTGDMSTTPLWLALSAICLGAALCLRRKRG